MEEYIYTVKDLSEIAQCSEQNITQKLNTKKRRDLLTGHYITKEGAYLFDKTGADIILGSFKSEELPASNTDSSPTPAKEEPLPSIQDKVDMVPASVKSKLEKQLAAERERVAELELELSLTIEYVEQLEENYNTELAGKESLQLESDYLQFRTKRLEQEKKMFHEAFRQKCTDNDDLYRKLQKYQDENIEYRRRVPVLEALLDACGEMIALTKHITGIGFNPADEFRLFPRYHFENVEPASPLVRKLCEYTCDKISADYYGVFRKLDEEIRKRMEDLGY